MLYYNLFKPSIIVHAEEVVCHAATTALPIAGITRPCVHILPLDRVGCFSFLSHASSHMFPTQLRQLADDFEAPDDEGEEDAGEESDHDGERGIGATEGDGEIREDASIVDD